MFYDDRDEVVEWDKEVKQLVERVMGLLSEGLGLCDDRLKGKSYLGRVGFAGHYYPYCPEPNKTVGISAHTDPGILTVLLQDQVGGLQIKYDNKWIDLKPVHGALLINIGDLFQVYTTFDYLIFNHHSLLIYLLLLLTLSFPRVSNDNSTLLFSYI